MNVTVDIVAIRHMQWSLPLLSEALAALLVALAAAGRERVRPSPGSHAGAKGSRERARLRACCGASCVADVLAPQVSKVW